MDGFKLDEVYQLRDNFIVLGLTGKISSGCSSIGTLLTKRTFDEFALTNDEIFGTLETPTTVKHNAERKQKIVYNFLKQNWKPFKLISYNQVLMYIIMSKPFEEFIDYLKELKDKDYFHIIDNNTKIKFDFEEEIKELMEVQKAYSHYHIFIREEYEKINQKFEVFEKTNKFSIEKNWEYFHLHTTYFNNQFHHLSVRIQKILKTRSNVKRIKLLELIADNVRKTGEPFINNENSTEHVYTIIELLNKLIITWKFHGDKNKDARIVIDSLRNSFEIMYMKERHSGFYSMSVNIEESRREAKLKGKFGKEVETILKLEDEEYRGKLGKLYKQDVRNCIQNSDIHLHNVKDIKQDNNLKGYRLTIKQQIVQYISLILQPGIVTPTPEERCMQMAFVAKSNSGCISRQVGAVVSDNNYVIKGVGWNNTPENQVPCLLRNVDDLIEKKDSKAFSKYELEDETFTKEIAKHYENDKTTANKTNLCGRNLSFCFRTIQNSITEGKNQIHTRSLHAEENAFLQITKYGGGGIKDGILFTTASPCELCAKKAYQLGIRNIYYVDPYPGISQLHILNGGTKNPSLILFNGAVGRAYHKLYEPFMAFKDELSILLDLDIKNKLEEIIEERNQLKEKVKILESRAIES